MWGAALVQGRTAGANGILGPSSRAPTSSRIAHCLVPPTEGDLAQLLQRLPAAPQLARRPDAAGIRAAVRDLVARLAWLADRFPQVVEVEVNPLVVGGGEVAAVDIRVRLEPQRRPWGQGPTAPRMASCASVAPRSVRAGSAGTTRRGRRPMKARDVMTHPVITVRPHVPASAAAALLVSHGFTAAPVVDAEGRLLGIATEADLMRGRVVPDGWIVEDLPDESVRSLMTPHPITARPDDDLADVANVMRHRGIRSLPVVDSGRLVGMVSRRDVLRCVARRELTSEDVRLRGSGHGAGVAP